MPQDWPRPLEPARGPWRRDKLDGAVDGMGAWGDATNALAAEGLVPPDMMTGLTLFLLSSQPRDPAKQKMPGGGGGVAGGVWVREQFNILRPLPREERFRVQGEALGRYVRKGRRYGLNRCATFDAEGAPVATNVTTGLLAYKVDETLADGAEGLAPDDLAVPGTDHAAARDNPCLERIRSLAVGEQLGGEPVLVGLDLMQARDTKKPDNPIHSDPQLARQAGLSRPIAGGSHVLAFALEPIMRRIGSRGLLYGTAFDVRWKAPVHADVVIVPRATVATVSHTRVGIDIEAVLEDGAVAMTGRVDIPLP